MTYPKLFQAAQDDFGRALPGATYTVYVHGSLTLATIFADDDTTHLANPGVADAHGNIGFSMPGGSVVDLAISFVGVSPRTFSKVTFPSLTGGGGGAVDSVNARTGDVVLIATDLPTMVASGVSHAGGAVPDPGASAGSTKFLREDATWAVPAGGGGGGSLALGYSPVLTDLRQNFAGFAAAGGNNALGKRFSPSERLVGTNIVGARFYWGSASAGSVVCKLWDASGTLIATAPAVTVGATSPGLYTATFGTPYTIVSGDAGKLFTVSMYDPSTVNQFNSTATVITAAEPGYTSYATGRYGTGDVFPGTDGGSNVYPVEPVFG